MHDLLSKEQKAQIIQYESQEYDLKTKEEIKEVKDSLEKKRNVRKFNGNMGEPGTVDEYILRYGVDPRTGKPETIKNFFKKHTIDPKTGIIVTKEKE